MQKSLKDMFLPYLEKKKRKMKMLSFVLDLCFTEILAYTPRQWRWIKNVATIDNTEVVSLDFVMGDRMGT